MLCRDCGTSGYVGGASAPADCPSCGSANIRHHAELFALTIAHIDCDAFYASVEKRDDPSLRDKPLIVGGRDRGVVAAACYIARQYGVLSAMPTWQALKKCPEAVVIRPRMQHYTAISREIRDAMSALTPLVQPLSIDEAFLDMTGTQAVHGCPPAMALLGLQNRIRREIGITVSVGLSGTKSLAKMASDRDKPDGFFVVGMAEAKSWLAPQPLSVIYGLGKAAVGRLSAAGLHSCGDLVAADLGQITSILGKQARAIQQRAAGIDNRAVEVERAAKSISNETTFAKDLTAAHDLEAELESLCNQVSMRLKKAEIGGGRVTVKLKRTNHQILTRSQTLSSTTDRAHLLFAVARELLLRELGPNRRFRLLGFGVDQLGPVGAANLLDLAGGEDQRRDKLEDALDEVRAKLGHAAVQSGRVFSHKTAQSKEHKKATSKKAAHKKAAHKKD